MKNCDSFHIEFSIGWGGFGKLQGGLDRQFTEAEAMCWLIEKDEQDLKEFTPSQQVANALVKILTQAKRLSKQKSMEYFKTSIRVGVTVSALSSSGSYHQVANFWAFLNDPSNERAFSGNLYKTNSSGQTHEVILARFSSLESWQALINSVLGTMLIRNFEAGNYGPSIIPAGDIVDMYHKDNQVEIAR